MMTTAAGHYGHGGGGGGRTKSAVPELLSSLRKKGLTATSVHLKLSSLEDLGLQVALLAAVGAGAFARNVLWAEAISYLQHAQQGVAGLNVRSYSSTATATGKGDYWSAAVAILRRALTSHLEIDAISLNSLGLQWRRAAHVVLEACTRGIQPDMGCFNTIMDGCTKMSRWSKSICILEGAHHQLLEVDRVGIGVIVSGAERRAGWSSASAALQWSARQAVEVNAITLNSAISASQKALQWRRAVTLLSEAQDLGTEAMVTQIGYNAALAASDRYYVVGVQILGMDMII
eukprot:TRINITY_DN25390_c0_g1_i2.p1 TRINITY_DN25390_c0_g1~~TRINITY_DN25390_c0_g1_i2.p1  ORF type:complete len:289 (+),score=52.85 TRINITY_DN25390_c0_g1_i2:136-1002(+)